eukprot:IDg14674t1
MTSASITRAYLAKPNARFSQASKYRCM